MIFGLLICYLRGIDLGTAHATFKTCYFMQVFAILLMNKNRELPANC